MAKVVAVTEAIKSLAEAESRLRKAQGRQKAFMFRSDGDSTPPERQPLDALWGIQTLAPYRSPEDKGQLGIKMNIKALCPLPSAFLVELEPS